MSALDVQSVSAEMLATHNRLKKAGVNGSALSTVGRLVGRVGERLARPPRLALLGEFNSGKTTLANALLGARVLPTSLLNNTSIPVLAQFGDNAELQAICVDGSRQVISWDALAKVDLARTRMLQIRLPLDCLKRFEVIDTPGLATGSISLDAKSKAATLAAHVAVWSTPATQAWKASEAATWRALPERLRKTAILVVTYTDALAGASELNRLEARLKAEALPYFAQIVMISAREAFEARINSEYVDDEAKWRESGGADLRAAIDTAIAQETARRVRMAQKVLQKSIQRSGVTLPDDRRLPTVR